MKEIGKTAIIMAIIIMTSKMFGFLREMILAYFYGTTYIVDAYLMATEIPSIIFSGVIASVATVYIPVYMDGKTKNGYKYSLELTNIIISLTSIIAIIVGFLGILLSSQIVSVFAPGFQGETYILTVKFLKIFFFAIIFIVVNKILVSYLQCNKGFIIEKLTALISNIVIISFIIISHLCRNIYLLVIGLMLSHFIRTIVLLIISSKSYNYCFKINLDYNNKAVKSLIMLSFPVFIGETAQQINSLVDKLLASNLVEGSIAALNYAYRVNEFTYRIILIVISTLIFPYFSKLASSNNMKKFNFTLVNSLKLTSILLFPIMTGTIILSKEAISVVYMRGNFNIIAAQLTIPALVCYSIGIIGFGYRNVLMKAFLSLHNTNIPMKNGIICVILNIALNLLLIKSMQHRGLALSTSIASLFTAILLLRSMKKINNTIEWKELICTNFKVIISSMIMGIFVIAAKQITSFISDNCIYILMISAIIGVIIYYILISYIFKINNWSNNGNM